MLPTSSSTRNGDANQIVSFIRKESAGVMDSFPDENVEKSLETSNGKGAADGFRDKEKSLSQSLAHEIAAKELSNDPQDVLLQSFWPVIAVYPSADTEELIRLKGIYGGFCDLLKPFGERVYGKVNVRDSTGGSRSWDDFGVHFTEVKRTPDYTNRAVNKEKLDAREEDDCLRGRNDQSPSPLPSILQNNELDTLVDRIMQVYLRKQEAVFALQESKRNTDYANDLSSLHHTEYLRKVLAPRPMTPHDTFTHPVACLIVTSSQNPAPIEKLRDLYSESRHGDTKVPSWAGTDFLRYYVLVHDEDHDDIGRSIMIYEQMKRHFGLHCHLLRLRSIECSSSTAASIRLPDRTWSSLDEGVLEAQQQEDDLLIKSGDVSSYLFNTDVDAITMFVREMITQSIVPFMEGRVTKWNDQVVSRRRGISGRFMSLSKRWTGFGSSRGSSPSPVGLNNTKNSNFNYTEGYYLPDSSEATMQRLADYAFMLRDWKLSSSVYDLLRADFADDKAWRHQALVSQMAVTSFLLDSSLSRARVKMDVIDQSIDSALYSYTARCADVVGVTRFLLILIELLTDHGGLYLKDASKWATRLLELSTLTPMGQAFVAEHLASCYSAQRGISEQDWASQLRKAAFWSLVAAYSWDSLGYRKLGQMQWKRAREYYDTPVEEPLTLPFASTYGLWDVISQGLARSSESSKAQLSTDDVEQETLEEVRETLDGKTNFDKQNQLLNLPYRGNSFSDDVLRLNGSTQSNDDGFS